MTAISCGSTLQPSELRIEHERAQLRHDEHLAIGAVEKSPLHGSIGGVQIDRASGVTFGSPFPAIGTSPSMKSVGAAGQRQGIPAQLIRRDRRVIRRLVEPWMRQAPERPVRDGRTNAVQPRTAVGVPRRGECRPRELLRIQSEGTALRRISPDRQRPGQRFGGKLIAEAALVSGLIRSGHDCAH